MATETRTITLRKHNPRDGERHEALIKALAVWRLCEGRRSVSIGFVAREVGVCERSVRRYLRALEYAGFAVPEWRRREQEAS